MKPPFRTTTTSGTNLEFAHAHNRRAVIEAIRMADSITRAELARRTALTVQTVSNITADLKERGLLVSHPPLKQGRGQPAQPLSLNPHGAYSIGVQIDHQVIMVVLVDFNGKMLARRSVQQTRPSPEQAMKLIAHLIDDMRQNTAIDWNRTLGAGVVMPGPFGVEGISSSGPTTLPGWDGVDVAEVLSTQLGLPVFLENDANAAAVGERLYGMARHMRDYVYLLVGTGLGAGIFLNGSLYRGHAGNSGEIGHVTFERQGEPCYCGNRGCLERYLSLDAAFETLGIPVEQRVDPDAFFLKNNSPAMEAWLDTASQALRHAVNIFEWTLDIESVIVGGFLPQHILDQLVRRATPLGPSLHQRGTASERLVLGSSGRDMVVLGAAALPIFEEFNPQYDALLKSMG